jgi:hypothetical protein
MPSFKQQMKQARQDMRYPLQRIEEQKLLIERLQDDAYDTKAAECVLTTFIELTGTLSVHATQLERQQEHLGDWSRNRERGPMFRQRSVRNYLNPPGGQRDDSEQGQPLSPPTR